MQRQGSGRGRGRGARSPGRRSVRVSTPVYAFLLDIGAIEEGEGVGQSYGPGGTGVALPTRAVEALREGLLLRLVAEAIRSRSGLGGDPIPHVAANGSRAARRFNWDSVLDVLQEECGLIVDEEVRKLLASGDAEVGASVLEQLCSTLEHMTRTPRPRGADDGDEGGPGPGYLLSEALLASDTEDDVTPRDAPGGDIGAKHGSNRGGDSGVSESKGERPAVADPSASDADASGGADGEHKADPRASPGLDDAAISGAALIASSCDEFLQLSLAHHLRIEPDQAAALLDAPEPHLFDLLQRGLRNQYTGSRDAAPVRNWLVEVYSAAPTLAGWALSSAASAASIANHIALLLSSLQIALGARDRSTVVCACRCLAKVAELLHPSYDASSTKTRGPDALAGTLASMFWQWLVGGQRPALPTLIRAWRAHNHEHARRHVIGALLWSSAHDVRSFMRRDLPEAVPNQTEQLAIIHELLLSATTSSRSLAPSPSNSSLVDALGRTEATTASASSLLGGSSVALGTGVVNSSASGFMRATAATWRAYFVANLPELMTTCSTAARAGAPAPAEMAGSARAGAKLRPAQSSTDVAEEDTGEAAQRRMADLRLAGISLIVELWLLFPDATESNRTIAQLGVDTLAAATVDPAFAVGATCIAGLVRLVRMFATAGRQHASAAPVFKTLLRTIVLRAEPSFVSGASERRQLALNSVANMLRRSSKLPVGMVVEPFIKDLRANGATAEDLDLLDSITKHPRLSLRSALRVARFLAALCVRSAILSVSAAALLSRLLLRFSDAKSLQTFLGEWSSAALSVVYEVDPVDGSIVGGGGPSDAERNERPLREVGRTDSSSFFPVDGAPSGSSLAADSEYGEKSFDLAAAELLHKRRMVARVLNRVLGGVGADAYKREVARAVAGCIFGIATSVGARIEPDDSSVLHERDGPRLAATLSRLGGETVNAVSAHAPTAAAELVELLELAGGTESSVGQLVLDNYREQRKPTPIFVEEGARDHGGALRVGSNGPAVDETSSDGGALSSPRAPNPDSPPPNRRSPVSNSAGRIVRDSSAVERYGFGGERRRRGRSTSDEHDHDGHDHKDAEAEGKRSPAARGSNPRINPASRSSLTPERRSHVGGHSDSSPVGPSPGDIDGGGRRRAAAGGAGGHRRGPSNGLAPSPPSGERHHGGAGGARVRERGNAARAAARRNARIREKRDTVDILSDGVTTPRGAQSGASGVVPGAELPPEVSTVVREHARALRQVFVSFAGTLNSRKPTTFASKQRATMSLAELTACCRGLDLYPSLVKRAELSTAFRTCASVKIDGKSLVVAQFAACLARICLAATSDADLRGTYESMPVGERVRAVFVRLKFNFPGKILAERLQKAKASNATKRRSSTPPLRQRLKASLPAATSKSH